MTGQALRQARTNAGMTQVEAAARFGVSQTLLSLMEKGERSVTPVVAELAVEYLRATPEELPLSFELRHSDESACCGSRCAWLPRVRLSPEPAPESSRGPF